MKLFISYADSDLLVVQNLTLGLYRLHTPPEVFFWGKDNVPGRPLWSDIQSRIVDADIFVPLLTEAGVKSEGVKREIGIALKAGKTIVSLVDEKVKWTDIGTLRELTCIPVKLEIIDGMVLGLIKAIQDKANPRSVAPRLN